MTIIRESWEERQKREEKENRDFRVLTWYNGKTEHGGVVHGTFKYDTEYVQYTNSFTRSSPFDRFYFNNNIIDLNKKKRSRQTNQLTRQSSRSTINEEESENLPIKRCCSEPTINKKKSENLPIKRCCGEPTINKKKSENLPIKRCCSKLTINNRRSERLNQSTKQIYSSRSTINNRKSERLNQSTKQIYSSRSTINNRGKLSNSLIEIKNKIACNKLIARMRGANKDIYNGAARIYRRAC